ncbi:cupredoxin domain-containing protein [Neobacillus niacini]|uniref:cupredoxin domain-containing protein n=1 Tax=Neobacillus niacini TaxID=86668 RepID=UPI002854AE7B|nr:cupredoxin domain-containing protein [Neobacillus niacini]MDR7000698.1 heme/copper-type cytochrome/quinol oxidase subunit 2 [Neobacillus niacini]
MNILSMFTTALVCIMTGYCLYLIHREKKKITCVSGMMIAMVVAMMTGLLSGYLIGIYSGDMFLSSGVSMIIGFFIGFLAGQPIGLMAILDGVLAGLMSGLMGAMLGVMLQFENPFIMLAILLGLYIIIMGLVVIFVLVETNKRFSVDTQAISPFAIFSAGVVAVTLFLFMYGSDYIKIPGENAYAQNNATVTQEEVDVSMEQTPKIHMNVTAQGYTPNVITVKKGVPVKLIIDNPLENSCLSTFTIREFNINKVNLKVGTTTLSFTPTKTGEYTFSCGMGMFKGTVMVK